MPIEVTAVGGAYLQPNIADVTVSNLLFERGTRAHIFVSWLHPYKEQRLVVIGSKKMVVFEDSRPTDKLLLFDKDIAWKNGQFEASQSKGVPVEFPAAEPLRIECQHFIDCIAKRSEPLTPGTDGVKVLRVLQACQLSLSLNGKPVQSHSAVARRRLLETAMDYFVHESSYVDEPCEIGAGTKIWHFSHIMKNCRIGAHCNLGQNVCVSPDVVIGNNCKIQNNVSLYTGLDSGRRRFLRPVVRVHQRQQSALGDCPPPSL